jgi:DNA mismatch repair protein MutS
MSTETPMMQQYHAIKAQYPDAFVFYRLGDFYELFEDDAIKGAKILELTLTTRDKKSDNPTPMAGIPHHAAKNYIDILVEQGHKVAIVEQMEDAATTKGMVKREVVQLVTPGTKFGDNALGSKTNNYLAAVQQINGDYGLAYLDLSTGELKATRLTQLSVVLDELTSLEVKEVVVENNTTEFIAPLTSKEMVISTQQDVPENATSSFLTQGLNDIGLVAVTKRLLAYLFDTQKRSLDHIVPALAYQRQTFLALDQGTRINLDLIENARTKKKEGSLLGLLDQTKTAMGGRLLKQWVLKPLRDKNSIIARQDGIADLLQHFFVRQNLQLALRDVYDLERLAARAGLGTMNARELIQLKKSLQAIPVLQKQLAELPKQSRLAQQVTTLDALTDVAALIDRAIVDEPALSVREGNIIKSGFNEQVDTYRAVLHDNQQWLAEFEANERQATGINSLKIGYNKNFGYFLEVTKANIPKLAENRYERRQTLTNAERFVTPELKEHEQLIVEAQAKTTELEYQLFAEVREAVKQNITRLQKVAQELAKLDVLAALADVAETQHFVRPILHEHDAIQIEAGQHPVVAANLPAGEFVPNDVHLDEQTHIQLITGPNMAGKSTYMRQLALLVIMAQMGSYVPAQTAALPIFDRIFTRIGANDDLAAGQSTFMVEMAEANLALQEATAHSLVLFDELGRGTATYDGMALAQSIIEYLHEHVRAKTLFATHYHELTVLSETLAGVQNIHVGAVEEADGSLVFLHQIQEGPADKSYGIHVAALAGMPGALIQRAKTILATLEAPREQVEQTSLFSLEQTAPEPTLNASEQIILHELKNLEISQLTPLQALNQLAEWQRNYE